MKFRILGIAAAAMFAAAVTPVGAQVLFTETFDDASSAANFNITEARGTNDSDEFDTYSEFGFDYSGTGSSRLTTPIPAAPGGGSMSGLVLAANLAGGNRSAINLFPIIDGMGLPVDPDSGLPVIDGDYRMTFDFWGGVNGTGPLQDGGAGTSEYLMVGAQSGGDGTHINGFVDLNPTELMPDSDFFELNINGDLSGSDMTAFTTRGGVPLLDPTAFSEGGFLSHQSPELQAAFPTPTYGGEDRYQNADIPGGIAPGTPANPDGEPDGGAPVEVWATAEISHVQGVTTLSFNGEEVGSIEFSDFGNDLGTNGLPWFGYTDYFNSQAGGDSSLVPATGGDVDGDANGDGAVDLLDLDILGQQFGVTSPGLSADFNTDGTVDLLDLDILGQNFGSTGGGGADFDPFNASFVIIDNVVIERVGSSVAVPEPASAVALALGLAAAACRRRVA